MVIATGFLGWGVVKTGGLGSEVAGAKPLIVGLDCVVVRTAGFTHVASTRFAH